MYIYIIIYLLYGSIITIIIVIYIYYTTPTHRRVTEAAFRLATSHYACVRKTSQVLLRSIFNTYPGSYNLVKQSILDNLALDPLAHHEAVKGTLYILCVRDSSLALLHDWDLLMDLWPALLNIKPFEKESIGQLLLVLSDVLRSHTTMPLDLRPIRPLEATVAEVAQTFNVPPVDPDKGEQFLATQMEQNQKSYDQLTEKLAALYDPKQPWRNQSFCLTMLLQLSRASVQLPPSVVRCVLEGVLNHNLNVRDIALKALIVITQQLKPKHLKITFCPYKHSGCERPSTIEGLLKPSVSRADNKWLQYDPKNATISEEDFNKRLTFDRTYLGFTSWPEKVFIYAPHDQQPPLDRSFASMSEHSQLLHSFLWSEEKLQKFVEFGRHDGKKGKPDAFNRQRKTVLKNLARNFGPRILDILGPILEDLVADREEMSQRLGAEIWSGIVRGAKHWPYTGWQRVMSLAISTLSTALKVITTEGIQHWVSALTHVSMDRDANFVAPILEKLLDFADFEDSGSSSFALMCKLNLLFCFLHQQQWRATSVHHRILPLLKKALPHPYKTIRDCVGSLIYCVFLGSTGMAYGHRSPVHIGGALPDMGGFVEGVVGDLECLQNFSCQVVGGGGAVAFQGESVPKVSPIPMIAASVTMFDSEDIAMEVEKMEVDEEKVEVFEEGMEKEARKGLEGMDKEVNEGMNGFSAVQGSEKKKESLLLSTQIRAPVLEFSPEKDEQRAKAFRIMNTSCSFLHLVLKVHQAAPHCFYQFLGPLCQLQSADSELEVRNNCISTLNILGKALIQEDQIENFIRQVAAISRAEWWRARSAALKLLKDAVFFNILTIMASPWRALVVDCVLARLGDERIEVRQVAANVLADLVHVDFLPDLPVLIKESTAAIKKNRKSLVKKNPPLAPSDRAALLTALHGNILALCAVVLSAPYAVPPYLPSVLCTLADAVTLPEPLARTVKDCVRNFHSTHRDNWQQHKKCFTGDELSVVNDLLSAPSYYV